MPPSVAIFRFRQLRRAESALRSVLPSLTRVAGKANIDQQRGLLFVSQQPEELNRAFVPALGNANLLRTGQLFVACHSLQSIPKGARIERGHGNRIVALYSLFGPWVKSNGRITARKSKRTYARIWSRIPPYIIARTNSLE